ncbi:EamA family transporter [Paenibacillus pasadenensis]|uniref:DMT family transporter n=1 Tax=Paenibacillus pasadenensis TaxID=217090 RepID=UPI00203F137C|nr:EamA family transporter [Paenibacillus pasadenensis]MCM3747530.1 EamA family transporter [Paenibacillus pasadenensis]
MVWFNYALMCAIFGTTFFAIKIGVEAGLPPFLSAGIRFVAAGALLFVWLWLRGKTNLSLLWRKEVLLIGAASTFTTFSTLYWGEQHIESGMAAVLSATGPIFILLMQSLAMKQPTTRLDKIGCALGFTGVIVLMLPKLTGSSDSLWLMACLVVLLGVIGYGSGSLLTRRMLLREPDLSPIALNSAQMTAGGSGLLLISILTESPSSASLELLPAAGSLLYLIVVGSMLGHSLYAWLIKATNAFFPSTWLYVSPIIALTLGAVMFQEQITFVSISGSLLVLAGIAAPRLKELKSAVKKPARTKRAA